ncbi:MAG: hypothetical protein H0X26_01540 [Alphaproteobacteria bacterium]|nr:hypothetical protein [Alphaproteobacteria bacterium]
MSSVFILMLNTALKAESTLNTEAEKAYEEEMSLAMCHSADHRFASHSNACVYCAQGLHYDQSKSHCTGTPNVLGKCYGKDHYHAKTQECMYCASGYVFNEDEDIRECDPVNDQEQEKKKI